MQHKNSVFHSILKRVPWDVFSKLVKQHGADRGIRRLSTKSQFVTLLYAQLSGAVSLREVEAGLSSHARRLYHLGVEPTRRSTLADANRERPSSVFSELLGHMLATAHRGLRRHMRDATLLIDSTSIRLTSLSKDWARFSEGVFGAKVHVVYDPDADQPVYTMVTAANVNDITVAQAMPITPGATYVYDLGYYDYAWWARLSDAGCRIVTRFKSNTPLSVVEELPVPSDGAILSDRIGHLPARQAANRRNPFQDPVREIRVRTDSGTILRILSNDLDASADELAELYKRRWAIELFFRWIKQTLKITKFLGTSENAIRIQVAVALIAFLLLRITHGTHKITASPLVFARLVRANLMHRRPLDQMLVERSQEPPNHEQLALRWA